jgi:DNA repair exonuclease SbcCD ATPase subunit
MSISSDTSASLSISRSEFLSSLPRWRRWLAKLNWHPTVDAQISALASERRMLRLESESEQIETESELIESEIEQIESKIEQIKSETEQIEQETEQLRQQNAKGRQLLASMHALCYPDASSSTHPPATATDSAPFSP